MMISDYTVQALLFFFAVCLTSAVPIKNQCRGPDDHYYPIGSTFMTKNCTFICMCNKEGGFGCMNLCDRVRPVVCPPNTKIKVVRTQVVGGTGDKKCYCIKQYCEPVTKKEKCVRRDGRILEFGEVYTTKDCRSKCRCRRNGVIRCTSLCGNTTVTCAVGERHVTRIEPIGKLGCTCKKGRCEKGKSGMLQPSQRPKSCSDSMGQKYAIGSVYISKNCTERCKCSVNGRLKCVSLCQNVWEPCDNDELQMVIHEPVPATRCSCKKRTCKKKTKVNSQSCIMEGHRFSGDEVYVSKNCTFYCMCRKSSTPHCSALCPARNYSLKCPQGFAEKTLEVVPFAPRCSCPSYKCINLDINRTEMQNKKLS